MIFEAIGTGFNMATSIRTLGRRLIREVSVRFRIISFFLMGLIQTARAVAPSAGELSVAQRWCDGALTQGIGALPFSFVYDGQSSSNLLADWKRAQSSRAIDETRSEWTVTFADSKTGLEVRCVAVE